VNADDGPCPVCGSATAPVGDRRSDFSGRTYHLRQCRDCWFSYVANPWTEYDRIYTAAYYAGQGADPHVDYLHEFEHPEISVRRYEWRGIERAVRSLRPTTPDTRWLDFGCGHGGLVRYLRDAGWHATFGYDTGAMADTARAAGLPILSDEALEQAHSSFEVVTLIEVLEHVPDPVSLLQRIRRLLAPGGVLFLTTGNAAPYRRRLLDWRYVLPDVHVSFFEPQTLVRALERAGFVTERRGFLPGHADIIRFKMLKALGLRNAPVWEGLLPWPAIARVVDWRLGVSGHPVGCVR
jgi:2-polyprenyl-3-methyl-5-hydroxy-6-metoxy-1,4-benzoquinol methylase